MGTPSPINFTAVILLTLTATTGYARQTPSEALALERFHAAVNEYVSLRHHLERSLPPLRVTSDFQEIRRAVEARAAAIRAARADARGGDIFGDAAEVLRVRIRTALRAREWDVEDLLADINEEVPPHTARPVVNDHFPWVLGAMMPPWILDVLPPLPEGLQYRLVGRDLVLLDLDANLVIDILPEALPSS